jgi:hypothetical protein
MTRIVICFKLVQELAAMSSSLVRARACWFGVILLVLGCRDVKSDRNPPSSSSPTRADQAEAASAEAVQDVELSSLRRIFRLSEAGEAFISDNVISNETSLLEPVAALAKHRGGAYIGVGPEQNYTYIALTRPDYAILIDLRRDNALLHFLYKSIFELAASRLEFISLLLGHPYDKQLEPRRDAPVDELLRAFAGSTPDQAWQAEQHRRLIERLKGYDLGLSNQDYERIRRFHQLFFERQLELRFELHQSSGRSYPTLGQLLRLRSAAGIGTFLDSSESFEIVQNLHRRHRIVPVVGDVSANRPLMPIADELRQRSLVLRTFYISNVEQYLVGQPSYRGWLDALRQLPHDDASILLRCYLDQGRRHPRQQSGSRTTTVAHSLKAFLERSSKRPHSSFFRIMTDESLDVSPPE